MKISKGLCQAYALQDFTYQAACSLRDSLTRNGQITVTREDAAAISALVRSWESCQERVRIHRGKPLPGSLRPSEPKPKRKQARTPPPPESA